MIYSVNRASPAGCVVGFFSLFLLAFAALGFYGVHQASLLEDKEKGARLMSELTSIGGICALLGLLLMFVAWRMIKNADLSDMGNPDKPKIRF